VAAVMRSAMRTTRAGSMIQASNISTIFRVRALRP
jgi:hypothetical protein